MRRFFLAVLAIGVLTGCSRGKGPAGEAAPTVRIAIVTDLEGYLEPCGCTSNPLGGINRLAASVKELRKGEGPVLLLIAGDTFYDAAPLEAVRVDQANRNASTLVGIMNRLGVTALLPGRRDLAQPEDTLAALREKSSFPWLATGSETSSLVTEGDGVRVAVIGARHGASTEAVSREVASRRDDADITVVLIDGTRKDSSRVGAIEGVDFVIAGGLDEDGALPPREAGHAWAFHAGRQGRGLTVVDVQRRNDVDHYVDRSEWSRTERAEQLDRQIRELAEKIDAWERSGEVSDGDLDPQRERLTALQRQRASLDGVAPSDGNAFFAKWLELGKAAPTDPEVSKLMQEHDKAVNQANRVAFADLEPPPLGPNDVAYVGSAACSSCHQSAYSWWKSHAHGVAYLTLQQRHKEYNLDCVGCHVTGYQQPGGSTVTHNLDMALVGVGCESCHGPGAAHAAKPDVGVVRDTPESTCVVCHNAEHSDLFDYAEYLQRLVVPGHGLPVSTR